MAICSQLLHLLYELEPVHHRHVDVDEQQIRIRIFLKHIKRLLTILRRHNSTPVTQEHHLVHLMDQSRIIYNDNFLKHFFILQ